ncbi:molybdenum cofactor guanylyltransferase [Heliorestis convoluta]|uniref:Probable molybdenum cofactor guanylyltransferase n=1 Tax=Heliorestis convoluta TaxID=356322 RepID=A0A5Q2N2I0_9FIRM|nr:molybdenum cofactor guanylyltransferase [Heliorestis convoluta]QGG47796.1 putative molybdenum cofactor guanylyltransferase [Heliorestis convoluta]
MEAAATILAGGQNVRMGKNKSLLPIGEKLLIDLIIEQLQSVVQEIIIVTNEPELYRDQNVIFTKDRLSYRGPLCGIHAALLQSTYQYNFIVACDMPFIQAQSIRELLELSPGYDVVVPKIGKHLQPLYAVYSKNCLPAIEKSLQRGERKVVAFYDQVRVRYVEEEIINQWGSLEQLFFNVNTPDDYAKAKEKIKEGT